MPLRDRIGPLFFGLLTGRVRRLPQVDLVPQEQHHPAGPQPQQQGHQPRQCRGARVAPTRAIQSPPRPGRTRDNGPVGRHPFEFVRQLGRRREPQPGLFLKTLETDGLEIAGNSRLEPRGRDREFKTGGQQGLHGGGPPEGGPAGQQLVQNRPQGVNVGRGTEVVGLATRLFRSHVPGRPQDLVGRGQSIGRFQPPHQPEIDNLGSGGQPPAQPGFRAHRSIGGARRPCGRRGGSGRGRLLFEQDVRRLEIAVQNARAMGTVNGPRQDRHQQCRRTWILRSPVNPLGQRRAVHILHGEPRSAPRFAHVKDLHDVRMPELGQRLGLLPEPLPLRIGQVCPVGGQLQCHGTPQALVSGAVHHPARPSSQQRLDLVTIDLGKDAAEHRIAGVVEPGQGLLQQRGRAGVGGDRRRIALHGAVGSPLGPGQVGGQLPGQTLIKPVAT